MDKNIPQFIVEKIEAEYLNNISRNIAKWGALITQEYNDNLVIEVLEWVLNNAKTTVTHTATILQERTATHENETIRFSQYEIHGEYFSPSELFTQFKKSKQSNV